MLVTHGPFAQWRQSIRPGKPIRVGEILDGVLESGYRSTSPNFRAIVNQTLIKAKQFVATSRGVYKFNGR